MKSNILFVFTLLLLFSCRKNFDQSAASQARPANIEINAVNVNNQQYRVNESEKGVVLLEKANKNGKLSAVTVASNYIYEFIGGMNAPVVSGNATTPAALAAASVQGVSAKGPSTMYVGYRRKTGSFAGAIEAVSVDDNGITLKQQLEFPHSDIYSLRVKGNTLFFSGSTDLSVYRDLYNAAFVGYVHLDPSGNIGEDVNVFSIPGDIAYDVDVYGDRLFVATGPSQFTGHSSSALIAFNLLSHTIESSTPHLDLRSVAVNQQGYPLLAVLSGQNGLHTYDASNKNYQHSKMLTPDMPYAQRKIAFYDNIFVANGRDGMSVLDATTGNVVDRVAVPSAAPYENPDLLASFSVDNVGGTDVLVANGSAGVYWLNNTKPLELKGTLRLDEMIALDVKHFGTGMVVATEDGVKLFSFKGNVSYPATCANAQLYDGDKDFVLLENQTKTYGGNLGVETFHVAGTYKNCGSIAASKNFTVTSTGNMEVYGNVIHGYTNSTFYLSVEPGGVLKIDGDLKIYGDLMLEGNIQFIGANRKLTVYGNVYRTSGGTVTGSYTDVLNKMVNSNMVHLPLNGTDKHPTTSQGVLAYQPKIGAGKMISFQAIFPRNMNNMRTMSLREWGQEVIRIEYAEAYEGKTFQYTRANNTVVTGVFGAAMNFN